MMDEQEADFRLDVSKCRNRTVEQALLVGLHDSLRTSDGRWAGCGLEQLIFVSASLSSHQSASPHEEKAAQAANSSK